jgi:hypothetical protein
MSLPDLSGLSAQLGGLLPSTSSLIQGMIGTAAVGVVLAGAKSAEGQNAMDPLHLIFHPATGTSQVTTGAAPKTISGTAYAALPAAQQAELRAEGYSIV